jgi:transcriptional regulator with PAS, ATPase and Fis domain
MSHQFIKLTPEIAIEYALQQFLSFRQDIACVFEHDSFLGIVTKSSIYRLLLSTGHTYHPIQPAIIENSICIHENENVFKAKEILVENHVAHSVVVNDERKIIGILSRADIVNGLVSEADHLTKKLTLLMNHLSSGIISVDLDYKITGINRAAYSFLGQDDVTELLREDIHKIFPKLENDLREAINNQEVMEMKKLEWANRNILCSIIPIKDWKKMIGAMIVLEDVGKVEKISKDIESVRINNTNESFSHIASISPLMQRLKEDAYIAAKGFSSILITGQSGTGKELLANGIHLASNRKGAFIKVNCGAIPESLMESEFFGYEDGAFTGAKRGGKPGKFELAKDGTLFLDEIAEMPLSLQVKLLRVLQEKEYEKVGGIKTFQTNARILAATNKNLMRLVQDGKFREDLYYRLNVIQLEIPPLKNRPEDIPVLCKHFIQKFHRYNPKGINGLTQRAMEKLQAYHWPGNVRELENVLERAYQFCQENWMEDYYIQLDHQTMAPIHTPSMDQKHKLDQVERNTIIDALSSMNGNKSEAAKSLGISRSNLYQKLKKYGIEYSYR